jgi:hypothetical protein
MRPYMRAPIMGFVANRDNRTRNGNSKRLRPGKAPVLGLADRNGSFYMCGIETGFGRGLRSNEIRRACALDTRWAAAMTTKRIVMALTKIVSGGQTGVDRGTLDVALAVGFSCGGWCPKDRNAEDGPIPDRYPMTLLQGGGYRQRTVKNVLDSDGTAILFSESIKGGTLFTHDVCRRELKPYIMLDATRISESGAAAAIVRFVEEHEIQVLNVAGPWLSKWAEGHTFIRHASPLADADAVRGEGAGAAGWNGEGG